MGISSPPSIPLLRPGSVHNGLASWDDCDRVFPDELRVSLFPDRFPHYAWTAAYSAHFDFVRTRMYLYWGVTCHLHFWQNDRGLLRATAVTRGWNGHRIRVCTQSWLWRWKFSRCFCRDSNSQPFDHESGALTNKLSRLRNDMWNHSERNVVTAPNLNGNQDRLYLHFPFLFVFVFKRFFVCRVYYYDM